VQRSETEYLAKLAGVVVEIEINFLGHGLVSAYESRMENRGSKIALSPSSILNPLFSARF
jgi:hypothetical protein